MHKKMSLLCEGKVFEESCFNKKHSSRKGERKDDDYETRRHYTTELEEKIGIWVDLHIYVQK